MTTELFFTRRAIRKKHSHISNLITVRVTATIRAAYLRHESWLQVNGELAKMDFISRVSKLDWTHMNNETRAKLAIAIAESLKFDGNIEITKGEKTGMYMAPRWDHYCRYGVLIF